MSKFKVFTNWEVHLESSNGYIRAETVARLLNEGWEIMCYTISQGNNAQMYFRRAKID